MIRYVTREESHRRFGGELCISDFCTYAPTNQSNRIVMSYKFDERCRKQSEDRDKYIKNDKYCRL